jgi:hypothetical protein
MSPDGRRRKPAGSARPEAAFAALAMPLSIIGGSSGAEARQTGSAQEASR